MISNSSRVLVILAPGAEEMEVTITVDVLRRGGVEVVLAGLDGEGPVTCSRGVRLLPDAALAAVEGEFDLIVLPGGLPGTEALAGSPVVGDLLRRQEAAGREIAAICAAPLALARHGVGRAKPMTCHPSVDQAVGAHGRLTAGPVVEAPGLITSRGPGTAFAFALALVARLVGADVAATLRASMVLD